LAGFFPTIEIGVEEALGGVSLTLDMTARFSVDMTTRFSLEMTARFSVDTFTHGGNDFGNAWLDFSLRSKLG